MFPPALCVLPTVCSVYSHFFMAKVRKCNHYNSCNNATSSWHDNKSVLYSLSCWWICLPSSTVGSAITQTFIKIKVLTTHNSTVQVWYCGKKLSYYDINISLVDRPALFTGLLFQVVEHNEVKVGLSTSLGCSWSLLTCHTDISECSTINLLLHKLNEELPPLTVLGCATFACVKFECEKTILYFATLSTPSLALPSPTTSPLQAS